MEMNVYLILELNPAAVQGCTQVANLVWSDLNFQISLQYYKYKKDLSGDIKTDLILFKAGVHANSSQILYQPFVISSLESMTANCFTQI